MDCLSNCVGVFFVWCKEKIFEGFGGDLSLDSILLNFCFLMLLLFVLNQVGFVYRCVVKLVLFGVNEVLKFNMNLVVISEVEQFGDVLEEVMLLIVYF